MHFSLTRYLSRLDAPETGPVALKQGQSRIYILPTSHGIVFGLLLFLMLIGSINYNLSLGYILTFLLGAMSIISALHTYRNLTGLTLHFGKPAAVFHGQETCFPVHIHHTGSVSRYSIALQLADHPDIIARYHDIPANETALSSSRYGIRLPATVRGLLSPGRIMLSTTFPSGLLRAWSYVSTDTYCIVYPGPEPANSTPLPASLRQGTGNHTGHTTGTDDFAGLRPYHVGDSSRHIAWKLLAREQALQTKQFSHNDQHELWFDWHDPLLAVHGTDIEARLSRLARWVLDAEARQLNYGLRLPAHTLPPGCGIAHQHQCLTILALFKPA